MNTPSQADELHKQIEHLLRFNCPNGCDGQGSYPEMSAEGEEMCQWHLNW